MHRIDHSVILSECSQPFCFHHQVSHVLKVINSEGRRWNLTLRRSLGFKDTSLLLDLNCADLYLFCIEYQVRRVLLALILVREDPVQRLIVLLQIELVTLLR